MILASISSFITRIEIYAFAYICESIYSYIMTIQPNQLFQLLSDETRLRSLLLLQQEGELCVCELMYALNISQPKVSRHLAMLRDAKMVTSCRQGQWVYYQIHRDLPKWVLQIIDATTANTQEQEPFNQDQAALAGMPNRPNAACCA